MATVATKFKLTLGGRVERYCFWLAAKNLFWCLHLVTSSRFVCGGNTAFICLTQIAAWRGSLNCTNSSRGKRPLDESCYCPSGPDIFRTMSCECLRCLNQSLWLLYLALKLCSLLTAVKRKSMRNALVPGRRPRKFPSPKFNWNHCRTGVNGRQGRDITWSNNSLFCTQLSNRILAKIVDVIVAWCNRCNRKTLQMHLLIYHPNKLSVYNMLMQLLSIQYEWKSFNCYSESQSTPGSFLN